MMEVKIERDLGYYEFLKLVSVISVNNKSIQKENMNLTFKNYNIKRIKFHLDKEIEKFNKALKN
jgi:hypothetical protein